MRKEKKDALTVEVSKHPGDTTLAVLALKGSLVCETVPGFEKTLEDLFKSRQFKIVLDLKETDYVSSAGWGIFMSEIKRLRKNGGDLILTGMNTGVTEIYDILEFEGIIKAFKDVEAAVRKGFGGA